jgi:hypothetical protein
MPLLVAAAFLSPSPFTVGTYADAVGKACRVVRPRALDRVVVQEPREAAFAKAA